MFDAFRPKLICLDVCLFVCFSFFLSTFRSSVAEISWGPYGQVNMLVLCKHRLPNIVWGLRINWVIVVVFFFKPAYYFCSPFTDWAATSLLWRSSVGPSGAAGWQAAGPGPPGGGKRNAYFFYIFISSPAHLPESLAPPFFTFLLVFSTQGIGGAASRNLMEHYAEVLFSLNKNCFTLLVVWLKEALQPPGFPSSRITDEQKANFSSQILR